jgi:urease accessory protein UreE
LTWKKNSNFYVFDDNLVNVDGEELNVVLRQANIDKDDDDIYIKDSMKVMTIQLTMKKKKILTNHQTEAICKAFCFM